MNPFNLTPGIVNLRFGVGAITQLPEVLSAAKLERPFIVTDSGVVQAGILDRVAKTLSDHKTGVFQGVKPNPTTALIDEAAKAAHDFQADCIIALGGGSSLDSAKGVALVAANPQFSSAQFNYTITPDKPALPIIAIPTTSGTGSETNNWGVIDDPANHKKIYVGDSSTTPIAAILDPELTTGLPPRATAGTGIDAMTHAIESLTSKGRTPISAAYAHEAIKLISRSLPISVNDGKNLDARGEMLMGAHLAGLALTLSGLGLVHGIAHSVSAHVGAAHGEALAAVLSEVMEFNARQSKVSEIYASVANDMNLERNAMAGIKAVRELADVIEIRKPLSFFGVTQEMCESIATIALADSVTSNNPIAPTKPEVLELLKSRLN